MKRTRILKLSIMSASALTLIACERSQEVGIFESLEQCSNQSIFSKEECSKSERLARSEHIRVSQSIPQSPTVNEILAKINVRWLRREQLLVGPCLCQ